MNTIFPKIFEEKKSKIKILILGTYTPSTFKQKLQDLKSCLVRHGFKNARLVADFPDKPRFHPSNWNIHFQRKSFHYIQHWAQALLFVYFKGANHIGVTREFSHMVDHVISKTNSSAILHHEDLKLSAVIEADIEGHRVLSDKFEDDEDLCEIAVGCCRDLVFHLFDFI